MNELKAYSDPLWDPRLDKILIQFLQLKSCHLFLDVGCGSGFWTGRLSRAMSETRNGIAVDIDRSCMDVAKRPPQDRGKQSVISDVHYLPFRDNTFDLVTCRRLLMNLRQKASALEEMIRVTKVNGICSCVEPDFTKVCEYSTVRGESRICKRIERGTIADLGFGPKAASLFLRKGLKEIDVWSYCVTTKRVPPYINEKEIVDRLHGAGNLENAARKLLRNESKIEKTKLIREAAALDAERKRQIRNNRYCNVEIIPFIVTKGTKSV